MSCGLIFFMVPRGRTINNKCTFLCLNPKIVTKYKFKRVTVLYHVSLLAKTKSQVIL